MRSRSMHYGLTRSLVLPLFLLACTEDHAIVIPASAQEPGAKREPSQVLTAEKVVGGGGLNMAVYEAGNAGGPPIIFIHGFTGSVLTWQRQFSSSLSNDFRLVTYDLRGHGSSDKPLDAPSYTTSSLWADDLDAVIRAKNLDHPVLVGWSYGGYVIADYIRKYRDDNIGGVVFLAAVTKQGSPEAASFLTDEVLALFPEILNPDVTRNIIGTRALTRMFGNPLKGDLWENSYGSAMMVPPEVRLAMFSRTLDNDDVLARIGVPALVIQGGADRIVKVSAARHIARTVPLAELHVYDGVSHAPQFEAPNRLNRDLAEFVRAARRP